MIVSRSSAEAEYRAVANVVAESCWLHQLLGKLHRPLKFATVVYYESVIMSARFISHPTTFSIVEPSMLRSIFILFVTKCVLATFVCLMFRRDLSLLTSLRRAFFRLHYFWSFTAVSSFYTLILWGGARQDIHAVPDKLQYPITIVIVCRMIARLCIVLGVQVKSQSLEIMFV